MANVVRRRHRALSVVVCAFALWSLAFWRSREKTRALARGATYLCMCLCVRAAAATVTLLKRAAFCLFHLFSPPHISFSLPSSSDIHAGPCAGLGEGGGGGERQQRVEWNSASLSCVCVCGLRLLLCAIK